jgi:3-deoxy-D-manno-octulosonic-acid transferase
MVLYRVIMALLVPFVLARALWRGETRGDMAERLGLLPKAGAAQTLWLHGASNGELTSARWVVADLLAAHPGLTMLVTSNTVTGRRMVQDWQLPRVTAVLAPLDSRFATGRLLRRWHPRGLISLEAEVWPQRMATCAAAGVPVVLLGARMSARSARGWQRFGRLAATALGQVRYASAQDALSRAHLLALGLPAQAVGPDFDLKAEAVARLPLPEALPRAIRAGWLLAASTHEGEDAALLDAFAASGLTHLILAPRHPARAPAIAALLADRGMGFARRSQGAAPGMAQVLLADTLGEMDLWYARCGICLVGGTLVDKGGHTPWEPARHGCALLHGPSTWNFTRAFAALDATGAALPVSAATLAETLRGLDGPSQDRLAAAAAQVLRAGGNADALIDKIAMVLHLNSLS